VPFGSPYVLDINVTGKSGATCAQNSRGEGGCATGTVTLTDNGTPLDGSPAGSGTFALNAAGSAEDTSIQLLAGTHNLVASYSGDVSFTKVTSPTDVVTVTKASTAISIGGPTSAPVGDVSYSISIDTQSNAQSVLPSGTVTFFDGAVSIGSTAIIGIFNSSSGLAQAVGTFTVGSLQPGQHSISAQYSGDANYSPSTTPSVLLKIFFTTTTTVSVSPSVIVQHQNMTIAAKVTANQLGGPAITGNVQFLLGGVSLGTANVSNGQAQLMVAPGAAGGSIPLTADYSGDANYFSSSGLIILQINPGPDFSVSTNPGTITISSPGATGTTAITITAQNGFTGMVTFACSGLPAESSCNAPAVNGSGTTTLSILTTRRSMTVPLGGPNNIGGQALARLLFVIAFCVCVVLVLIRRGEQRWITALALIALASVVAMSACGGGGGGTGPTNPGTPTGNANVTVTATGTINGTTTTHTVPVTVDVL
jgi:hypothetical protein